MKLWAPNFMEDARRVRSWLWKFERNTTLAPGAFDVTPTLDEDIRGAIYIDEGGLGQEDLLLWVRKNDADALEIAEVNFGTGGGGGISNVVEDTTPTLGGNLDVDVFSVGDADAADLTKLSQLTATSTELNYVDGVTSGIQGQIDAIVGASGATLEQVYDALGGGVLVAGNNIDIVHDDLGDTITIAVETLTLADVSDITASATEVNYTDGVTSAIQTQLDGKQPLDGDLTTIAGLTATTDNFMVSVASAWASRTPAQAKTTLALVKGDVGLGNVDNTSDANKPVSTAQQTALDLKANDADVVHDTGNETIAGVKTFSSDPLIPDEVYGVGWDGSLEPPTKNAVYDKIEAVTGGAGITLEQAYDAIAASLVAGNNIDLTVDDGLDTVTIAVETLTTADISDITASASELNILDGATLTVTELNYVDGVTSAIQTQINGKVSDTGDTMTGDLEIDNAGAFATLTLDGATDGGSIAFQQNNVYQGGIYSNSDNSIGIGNAGSEVINIHGTTGVSQFFSDVIVPDEAYGAGWNASVEVPTKNAVYDQVELRAPKASPTFTGTVTLPVGLTGVIRTDTGVVSVDTDVTDIVAAASDIAAGKVELATTAETTTGTDATRAVTPDGLHDMTSIAGAAWIVDEDDMVSNLDTKLPTQQSVKAYADLKAPKASPTFTGTVTLPVGLTGVIRTDTGVVSVDTDVTDIVTAATTGAAGKVELATDAETNTGTDTTRAITPSNLEAWTGSAFITTVGTLASPVLTTPTIASFTNATHTHADAAGGGTLSGYLTTASLITQSVVINFGNGTDVISINDKRNFSLPVAHTLIRWRILSTVSGTIEFDVWRDSFANFPNTVTESVSTSHPLLSGAFMAEDSTITDWTEVGSAGDVYTVNVHAAPTSCVAVVLELWYTRALA